MSELKSRIHDDANDLDYVLAGDYYIPDIELPKEDDHSIGKWGQMNSIVIRVEENIRREMIYV